MKHKQNSFPRIDLISFAQNGEDIVLYRTFKDRPPGFYVDAGAGHPIKGSITKNLYDRLGWHGLDIEPQTHLAQGLVDAHRRSKVINGAVVTAKMDKTQQKFYEFPSDWALSTLNDQIAQSHKKQGLIAEEYLIPCLSLNTLLESNFVKPEFELLKIDIEGMDLEVLCDFDFDHWKPTVILVESLCPSTKERVGPALDQLMQAHGYEQALFDGINSFYLYKAQMDLKTKLSIPANSRDFYLSYYWWRHLPEEIRSQYPQFNKIR